MGPVPISKELNSGQGPISKKFNYPSATPTRGGGEVGRWRGGKAARWGGGKAARWGGGEVEGGEVRRWGGGRQRGGKVGGGEEHAERAKRAELWRSYY